MRSLELRRLLTQCLFARCAGTFFPIPRRLLGKHAVCVTHARTANAISANPALTRLDRCFIAGSNQDLVRQYLRVLAGRRTRAGDPERLQPNELQQLLNACPAPCK